MVEALAIVCLTASYLVAWMVSVRSSRAHARERERRENSWAAERKQLLDRIMYLADKPWSAPDIEVVQEPEYEDPFENLIYPEVEV